MAPRRAANSTAAEPVPPQSPGAPKGLVPPEHPIGGNSAGSESDDPDVLITLRPVARGLPARLLRWLRLKWFQYEITMAVVCFEWWEKAILNLCVLSVLSLFAYGFYRQACAIAPVLTRLASRHLHRLPLEFNMNGFGQAPTL